MSVNDLSGRLLLPSTGRRHRLLSSNESTACCSIRFSFRIITSGAFRSISFLRRLFRLMIRRYKSFRSLVAKFPLSSITSGRRSGGITGATSMIIHSGLFSLVRMALTIFNRFVRSLIFCLLLVSLIAWRSSTESSSKSNLPKSSLTASAPMDALKQLPYFVWALRYSSSVRSCFSFRGLWPQSVTT